MLPVYVQYLRGRGNPWKAGQIPPHSYNPCPHQIPPPMWIAVHFRKIWQHKASDTEERDPYSVGRIYCSNPHQWAVDQFQSWLRLLTCHPDKNYAIPRSWLLQFLLTLLIYYTRLEIWDMFNSISTRITKKMFNSYYI